MITHNEIAAGLWFLVAASSGGGGLLAGRWWWPSRKREDSIWRDGYEQGADDEARSFVAESERRAEERSGAFTLADPTPEQWVRAYPETAPGAVRPAGSSPAAGCTIYPELAALDGPQAGSAGTEAAGVLGWRAGPHWYPDGLHWLADWQADWHAASASFDDWLPGYLDWFRRSLEPSWSRGGELVARAMEQMS